MIRTTLKGHGNPTRLMYFGHGREPLAEGWLVTVARVRGGANLVDETETHGPFPVWAASATKFWAEMV